MTRKGTGISQVEEDFMSLLMRAGLGVQQTRLALSNPMVAQEVVAVIKRETKSNAIAQIVVERHLPYELDSLKRVFLGGITDAYGSPAEWRDSSLDADHRQRSPRTFVARRYKKTVKTTDEIIEAFRAAGFRPANLHEACVYLPHHVHEVQTNGAKCQRDIVLLGTMAMMDGEPHVPYLSVQTPSAQEVFDFRLEFVPANRTWGMDEWFLFVQEPAITKSHPPDHVF